MNRIDVNGSSLLFSQKCYEIRSLAYKELWNDNNNCQQQ